MVPQKLRKRGGGKIERKEMEGMREMTFCSKNCTNHIESVSKSILGYLGYFRSERLKLTW